MIKKRFLLLGLMIPMVASSIQFDEEDLVGKNGLFATSVGAPSGASARLTMSDATLDGYVKLNNDVYGTPRGITVLAHGMGNSAAAWSNGKRYSFKTATSSTSASNTIVYNSDSIIDLIKEKVDYNLHFSGNDTFYSNLDIIVPTFKTDNKIQFNHYVYEGTGSGTRIKEDTSLRSEYICDTSKHILIIYDSRDSDQGLDNEYRDFKRVINSASYDYKLLSGKTPELNLIGFSNGGLLCTQYAIDHPYNVDSLSTIATPFNGTSFIESARDIYEGYQRNFDPDLHSFDDTFSSGVYQSIVNPQRISSMRSNWNNMIARTQDHHIEATAYGSVMTVPYVEELLKGLLVQFINSLELDDYTEATIKVLVSKGIEVLNDAIGVSNDMLVEDNVIKAPNNNVYWRYPDSKFIKEDYYKTYYFGTLHDLDDNEFEFFNSIVGTAFKELMKNKDFKKFLEFCLKILFRVVFKGASEFGDKVINFMNEIKDSTWEFLGTAFRHVIYPGYIPRSTYNTVLYGDMCVDFDSQMATGYSGFERKYKFFTSKDIALDTAYSVADAKMPPVPHNVILYNKNILVDLVRDLYFGTYDNFQVDSATTEKNVVIDFTRENGAYTKPSHLIGENTDFVTIIGNPDQTIYDPSFVIAARPADRPLFLTIKNLKIRSRNYYMGPIFEANRLNYDPFPLFFMFSGENEITADPIYTSQTHGIYFDNNSRGTIESHLFDWDNANVFVSKDYSNPNSTLTVIGADGYMGYSPYNIGSTGATGKQGGTGNNGSSGYNGEPAFVCNSFTMMDPTGITIKGGNGGNGGCGSDGGTGGAGTNSTSGGGAGGKGGTGGNGGKGGDAAPAVYCYDKIYTSVREALPTALKAGIPGNGGFGGNGGNGGRGGTGVSAVFASDGGRGGDGGLPGYGGDAGYPTPYTNHTAFAFFENSDVPMTPGDQNFGDGVEGGIAGNYGNGGKGGDSESGWFGRDHAGAGGTTVTHADLKRNSLSVTGSRSDLFTYVNGRYYFYRNGKGYDRYGGAVMCSTDPWGGTNGAKGLGN